MDSNISITNDNLNKGTNLKISFSFYLIFFMFLYALFAPDRIKNIFSFKIDGINTTNELWLLPLISIFILLSGKFRHKSIFLDKYNRLMLMLIYGVIFVIAIGGFYAMSVSQYIYALLLFIVPIQMYFLMSGIKYDYVNHIFKILVSISLIYAIFAIILSTNYAFFMSLVGNEIDNRYYYQYRPSMMLGSSITVSYYLNISLPLSIYMFFRTSKGKWRLISMFAIISNVVATFILSSRLASIVTIFILIFYFLMVRNKRNTIRIKALFIIFLFIVLNYVFKNYDLSRILMGFDLLNTSESERFNAGVLGLYIFAQYPIFGSGMGRFFERIYTDKYINVDGLVGLIDPHNMYILVLSEMGIIGFVLIMGLFIVLFKNFSYIKEDFLRRTSYVCIFIFLLNSIGGSHLINEISYSIIFWLYMGLFNVISMRDRHIHRQLKSIEHSRQEV